VTVTFLGHRNQFYIFGGRDESSASLIQGITFAGVLLDEVALMPKSFVEQACARCSVDGSRLWFNCNPAGPSHWFYKDWILEAEKRNCLRLHFTMEDNPSLTPAIRQRYERLYSGVFYRRFVRGEWAQAEGRVYDFFEPEMVMPVPEGPFEKWYISCDYGTVNPTSMGLWGLQRGVWYRVKEFYFDSRAAQRQMTDEEYAGALEKLAGGRPVTEVIIDPSAASFMETLRRHGWRVRKANNDVLSGIRLTADCLKTGKMVICQGCDACLREMDAYVWDLSSGNRDRVKKENDHAMDDMRYFAATVLKQQDAGFAACAVERRR
jgi:PBSX family phage terminase large subunit